MPNFDPQLIAANMIWIIPLAIWDLVWKAVSMWYAARNGQKGWYIALLIINSVGILPMVYLKFFQKKQ